MGNLEILALSFNTKHQICIYEQTGNEAFCLRAKIPIHCNNWPIVHVSYRMDTEQQAGHFDLLIKNPCPVTCEPVLKDFKEVLKNVAEKDKTFIEMVKSFIGCNVL